MAISLENNSLQITARSEVINNRNNVEWQLSDKIAHSEGTGERNKLKTARSGTTSDRNNFEYNNKHLGGSVL